jgi:hypothetical protein
MPIDPVKRLENWNEKYNIERITAMLTEKRPKMLEHITSAIVSLAAMEQQVKQTCDASGVPYIQYPFYLNFGREMWSRLNRDMSGESLSQEAAALIAKWVARGLSQPVLQAIRSEVFNVPAPIAP